MIGKRWLAMAPILVLALNFSAGCQPPDTEPSPAEDNARITLPEPRCDSDVSVEEALLKRRSVRNYTDQALTLQEISQLLWRLRESPTPAVKELRLQPELFTPLSSM